MSQHVEVLPSGVYTATLQARFELAQRVPTADGLGTQTSQELPTTC